MTGVYAPNNNGRLLTIDKSFLTHVFVTIYVFSDLKTNVTVY